MDCSSLFGIGTLDKIRLRSYRSAASVREIVGNFPSRLVTQGNPSEAKMASVAFAALKALLCRRPNAYSNSVQEHT